MGLCNKSKGILVMIGGILVHIALGTIYSYGLLNPFMVSYLYQYNSSIGPDDGFFLMPLSILFEKFFVSIGGLIENKAGPRV